MHVGAGGERWLRLHLQHGAIAADPDGVAVVGDGVGALATVQLDGDAAVAAAADQRRRALAVDLDPAGADADVAAAGEPAQPGAGRDGFMT